MDRLVPPEEAQEARLALRGVPRARLTPLEQSDLELVACGALSPLEGFMTRADYESTLGDLQLERGLPWALPITLVVPDALGDTVREGDRVALEDAHGDLRGDLEVRDRFEWDPEREARVVYGTTEEAHPGVAALLRRRGRTALGGPVRCFGLTVRPELFPEDLTPAQTREAFVRRGWSRVVGFQTRNPIHRAHEYLIKCALEGLDGALIHPLVGETKAGDIPAAARLASYRVLIDHYFPPGRVVLGVLPAAMRYAGPREAVHHAILRRNYGCSHFIVGRDHAGVGAFYGTYDAQRIFDELDGEALGIEPIRLEHSFFCRRCAGMASSKTCPHLAADHVILSGTEVRRLLSLGQPLPPEITRPEVAKVLIERLAEPDFAI